MIHAGIRSPIAPNVFYGLRVVLPALVAGGVALVPAVWSLPPAMLLGALCGAAAIAWVVPSIYLDARVSKRRATIERGLPDALDLMVVCVEAGFGINQALARVSEEFAQKQPDLASEFALVVQETRAGKTTA